MSALLVALEPPVAAGRAKVWVLRPPIAGAEPERAPVPAPGPDTALTEHLATLVEQGVEQVIVDLDGLPTPDTDAVKTITDLVWSILAAGARPVVVAGRRDTAEVVRHFKMDRAFAVVADLAEALELLVRED